MKRLGFIVLLAAALAGCAKPNVIEVEVPARPAGQEDVIGLTAPALDTVRVGIIGLGMRGRGAVHRFARIPGAKVVALCDLSQASVDRAQERLAGHLVC